MTRKTRQDELLDELLADYSGPESFWGESGLFASLKKRIVERTLEAEMDNHLGYSKHDPKGNMTSDGQFSYIYNQDNQLVNVRNLGGTVTIASYGYDYAGRRVSKAVGGATTWYVYDGVQVIAEYSEGVLNQKFIYGPGIDQPVAMINYIAGTADSRYYYHSDALGSIIALSNASGSLTEKYEYLPFGEQAVYYANGNYRGTTSSVGNPYMFTRRRYDSESQLYYYRARMYSARLGRFMQIDPLGYYDSMNLYQYCRNNPVNLVDPLEKPGTVTY